MLELKGTDTQAFDDAVEELAKVVNHHLTEEELTILNPAREEVGEQVRAELGEAFATERNAQLDDDCGTARPTSGASWPRPRRKACSTTTRTTTDRSAGRRYRAGGDRVDVTQAEALCAGLPGAWPDNPWDHDHPVYKVGPGERGKIFAFLGATRSG